MLDMCEPSVRNAKKHSVSEERLFTSTPWRVTSSGSFGSARLTAFWTLTMAMSVSVPGLKYIWA